MRRETLTLWLAARDPRTPRAAKWVAAAVAAYAFSPIDLIPDFIPVLGLLDDLLIVPAGIWLALRLIPPPLMEEFRVQAAISAERPVSLAAAITIGVLWLVAIVAGAWQLAGH